MGGAGRDRGRWRDRGRDTGRETDRDRQTETAGQCCGVGDVTGVKYHWQPPPLGHLHVGREWHEPPKKGPLSRLSFQQGELTWLAQGTPGQSSR